MRKNLFILATAAIALASCTNDEFLGGGKPTLDKSNEISFSSLKAGMTKADITGSDAATLLGGKFYVLGTKGTLPATQTTTGLVFDNYQVNWGTNTAGTTTDNTDDWSYIGITPTGLHTGTNALSAQSIKYWDYSADQYDFIAYSVGANTLITTGTASDGNVLGTAIAAPSTAAPTSFTLTAATIADLKECYFTDVTTVLNTSFGQPVQLKFKNLTAKVRVAFYETIPGYTVSGIEFYQDATTKLNADISSNTGATLFTTGSDNLAQGGAITVTYPVVGKTERDASTTGYNKAFVSVSPSGSSTATTLNLGTVNYSGTPSVIATTAKEATMAGTLTDSYYSTVLPATGHALTLRVNYTLTSTDGSGETIKVYGATAVIPASYTAWQPNYAYTYIFKISDNTNGWTYSPDAVAGDATKAGLFPITFDAVVASVADADFNQETITTVASSSVTTYAFNSSTKEVIAAYGTGNEYPAAATTDIYVSVQNQADLTNGVLYNITKGATPTKYDATEAEVIDALQIGTADASGNITGRNGVILTKEGTQPVLLTTDKKIPTEDGKGIALSTGKEVAKFTATATATTYVYVYQTASGTASYLYTAETVPTGTVIAADTYYTDHTGGTAVAAGTTTEEHVYYKKITNNNNTYAVKVIKTY